MQSLQRSCMKRGVLTLSKSTGKKIFLTAIFMAAATLLSKVLGQVRDSMLTAYFGSGMESDAFLTATTIPTTLFDVVIGGVISASFIPVFNDIMSKKGKEKAFEFVNKFVTLILCISVLIMVFGIIFRSPLVSIQANYTGEKHLLASRLTAIMFPMIIFTGLAFSFVGLLQSFGEYNIPSIISLVSNAAIILYYVLFGKKFGVYGLAVTMVIAWSLQFLIQVPWIKKFGIHYRPDFRFKDPGIKQMIMLAGPMLISTWVQPLCNIINQRFASNIDAAVTQIQQSSRLYIIVTGVFSFVVTNLVFPKLAQAVANNDKKEARTLIVTSMKSIFAVIMPIMAILFVLAQSVSNAIYGYGKMDAESVHSIGVLLQCYSLGMIWLAVNEVLSKAFFSMQDSKPPMRNSVISMIVNIVLAYLLYNRISTPGLALATVCGSVANAALNYICMIKKYPGIFNKSAGIEILKTVICAFIMCPIMYFAYNATKNAFGMETVIHHWLALIISGGAGIVVYLVLCLVLKVDVIWGVINNFKGGKKLE